MTMHEADRPADYDSVEEEDELGGRDVLTDEQHDPMTGTDVAVAEADLEEPGDDDRDATWSREDVAVDEDADEGALAEPEPVETDEVGEPARAESADAAHGPETVVAGRTPGSGPLEKLAPVGPESAMDPGTGSYEERWGGIQAGFIDDPRRTVESASALVAEIWDEIARAMTDEREGIDDRWRTAECSTDDLRAAMQDYRTLYTRSLRFASGE
jgi:hypothetical protein